MVRTLITPLQGEINLKIDEKYIGKTIEITYLAVDELYSSLNSKKTLADFWGKMSDDTAQILHREVEESRNQWEERLNKQF
jgi:hypothetical protein